MTKDFDRNHRFTEGNTAGNRFQPGESGNPKGPPKAKTQLWRFVCVYLDMTDTQFTKLKAKKKLTQAQQAAINIIEDFKAGKVISGFNFARYAVDRDLGKALETIQMSGTEPLTDDECADIREIMRKNGSID